MSNIDVNPAIFSKTVYKYNTNDDETKRAEDVTNELKKHDVNYSFLNDLSNRDIGVFKSNDDNTYHIAHRGTDVNSKKKYKDINTDATVLYKHTSSNQLDNRSKYTNDLIDHIKKNDPNSKIHLSGHSLGGLSVLHSINENKNLINNIDSVSLFNPLLPLNKKKNKMNDEQKDKITIHRVKDDIPSYFFNLTNYDVKTYKQKQNNIKHVPHYLRGIYNKSVNQLNSHTIDNFI